jgi:hypothetical protein
MRETTAKLPLQLAVLTDHECGTTSSHTEHQPQGAKVPIFDPEIICLDVLEHLSNQAALLGMTILVQKDIGNQHTLLLQPDQGLSREGCGPGIAQCFEAVRSRRQVITIEDLHLIPGQPARVTGPQGFDSWLRQCSRVAHESRGPPGFNAIELVVQGSGRHPHDGFVGLLGGVHGRMHSKNDFTHQLDQGGKQ